MMEKEIFDLIDQRIGQKMREARSIKGMTQEKLGEHLGVTFQQIQKYEKAKNRVAASRLYHLANILECPVGYFFEEPDREWPEKPGRDFSTWLVLYNKTSPETRKILFQMASTLSEKLRGKRQRERDGETTSI